MNKTTTNTIKAVDERFAIYTVHRSASIREAFKKHDINEEDFILVADDEANVLGIVTTGDFHKAIWNGTSLEETVEAIMNRDFVYFTEKDERAKAAQIFADSKIKQIPVLSERKLKDIIFRNDKAGEKKSRKAVRLKLPVVIMAGGFGTRLDPFTRILPKPLIPIGEKPIIELIIEKFNQGGIDEFYISLNHKARMVKAFFEETSQAYKMRFIEEDKPLGTVGALKLLEGKIDTPFIVSNCDILIETDYAQIVDFHAKRKYGLTIVASMQHHVVPYGVCETKEDGELNNLTEKPHYDFLVNTGMYVFSPQILKHIPADQKFDITDLIEVLKRKKERIGVFPISEKSWIDIGQWEEYKQTIQKLSSIFMEEK